MGKKKRKLTAAEKAAKKRRREEFMTIFVHGKMKRVRRPPTIDGMPVDEFIRRNADPIWLHQNEMWELMDETEYGTGDYLQTPPETSPPVAAADRLSAEDAASDLPRQPSFNQTQYRSTLGPLLPGGHMQYYEEDAAVMEHLRKQIEALGMPLLLFRKFNLLVNAITVQVEVEGPSRPVVETLFDALMLQAEEIRQPECDRITAWIEDCRMDIAARLIERDGRGSP